MVVGEIVPDGDATPNDWSTALPHWSLINEDRNSPICLNSQVLASNYVGDDNELEQFNFTTLDNIVDNSITQVKVWSYGSYLYDGGPEIAVSWNDGSSWTSYVASGFTTSEAWSSVTWSGLSYSKSDLDQFQVSYRANVPSSFAGNKICCVYVEVTYTSSVVGYSHKFCGVLPANIGKVSGVATANIGKVKGV